MRVLFCGGGTGGHVNPAIAIANTIKQKKPDTEIAFVGTLHGIESSLVPKAGYPISFVKVRGFKRKLTLSNIDAAVKAVTSVWKAKKIIKNFKPDVVVGTGGYVSWPTVKAAAKMGIPCVIHEQNAFPGVTTKMLSKLVLKVCISFEESRKFFDRNISDKLILTGNPINISYYDYNEVRKEYGISEGEPYILSSGGSMGADKVNEYVFDMMEKYSIPDNIRHTHAVGRVGWEKYSAIVKEKGFDKKKNLEIEEFIYDMPKRQSAADIVISRAGAISLAELAFRGKAAIFIPSPNVAENHQEMNARSVEKQGGAVVMPEKDCTGELLYKTASGLLGDQDRMAELSARLREIAVLDSAERIYSVIVSLGRESNQKERKKR
jgi:UDP-N-acetylglucosamine--N-acetylmuramyl-(pentapeptide) pyrophosphoryl-undecaprenol N-acetylglucosamine transferase